MALTIASLNVRGLRDKGKRREVFNWLRTKKFSIYLLQEVHCTEDTNHVWSAEWGYQTIFSTYKSNKAGVCILFNNNFDFQIEKAYIDPQGRFIVCDIQTNGKSLTLANIYAPNDDNPAFFLDFFDHLTDFKCEDIIIGGDYNLVLDLEKDKKGGLAKTHQNSVKLVEEFCEKLDLVDVWRILHPDTSRFTWRQHHPKVHCRLDFFLISQSTVNITTSTDIVPGYKSDHSMITLSLSLHSNPRGPGFWKLNTSFLTELDYVNQIKTTIQETRDEYKNDESVNPVLLWEMIKLKVREKSIHYSKNKMKQTRHRETNLEQTIARLEAELDNQSTDDSHKLHLEEQLNENRLELEKIIELRTKGAILRSKSKWYNEGEKNTKYFLNLEKRHYKQGTISQIKTKNGEFVTANEKILNECENFYKNLYSSTSKTNDQNDINFCFECEDERNIYEEDLTACEGELTEKECLEALKDMESEKTPGTDGLPAEFYKVFWNDISTFLICALNHAYKTGLLSITQRRGIIKLIPKKDAEPYFIKNWRPLTLLNCDYKIAAKSIANRLKPYLPSLINYDQTGFLKGRFIGENIRLIDSVICYAKEKNIPGLLLFLDFEKAFDTIEWGFIKKTFHYFGFGSSILKWLNLFYSRPESCVLNNGWASNFFEIQRGVRQGCPLSPYLFVLSAEILAKKIRENKSIKGIFVNNKEIKLSQYADDTTLILDGTKESLIASLKTLDDFYEISGLKLNDKKTEAFWIGASCGNAEVSIPDKNFKWPKYKVKALGVWFSIDPEATASLNYSEKLDKVRNVLSCWKYRRLTLIGKITVLKSLVASQLVYVLAPLHTNAKVIKEVNKLFYAFLWNGKGDKIKRDVIVNDYSNGGLKMIDIQSFNKSLKATWIKKYLDKDNQGKWKYFFENELEKYGGTIVFDSNLNKNDTIENLKFKSCFMNEILSIWSEVNFEEHIMSEEQFLEQSLWYNSLVKIGSRPIFYREWFDSGITKVKDLKDGVNNFLSLAQLQNKYNFNICPLKYNGLRSALKSLWNTCKNNCANTGNSNYENFAAKLAKCHRASKLVYTKLLSTKCISPIHNQEKWLRDCNLNSMDLIDWRDAYQLAAKYTKSARILEFQYKLLHRRISTNDFLTKIGIEENPNCSFCSQEPEKLLHLFWSCPKVASFWHNLTAFLTSLKITTEHYTIDMLIALGLKPDSSKNHPQINFCCLLARNYIWISKRKKILPRVKGFQQYLKSIYDIEISTGSTLPLKWKLLSAIFE